MTEQNQLPGTPESNSKMAQQLEKEMAVLIRRIDKLNHRLAELPEEQRKSLAVDGGNFQKKKEDNSLSVLYRLPGRMKNVRFDFLLVKDEKKGYYGITFLFRPKTLLLSIVIALGLNAFFIPPAIAPENILPQAIQVRSNRFSDYYEQDFSIRTLLVTHYH